MKPKKTAQKKYPDEILSTIEKAVSIKKRKEYKKAIKLLEELLVSYPDCVKILEELSDNYFLLKEYKKAERAANYAMTLDSSSPSASFILGMVKSRQGNFKEASELLGKANKGIPNNYKILRFLGWSLFNRGDQVKGLVVLERALNLNPEDSFVLCDLGFCYMQMQNFQKSLDLFYRALELNPRNKRARDCIMAIQNFKDKVKNKN